MTVEMKMLILMTFFSLPSTLSQNIHSRAGQTETRGATCYWNTSSAVWGLAMFKFCPLRTACFLSASSFQLVGLLFSRNHFPVFPLYTKPLCRDTEIPRSVSRLCRPVTVYMRTGTSGPECWFLSMGSRQIHFEYFDLGQFFCTA